MAEKILNTLRLDKWLKIARFYKKRSEAAAEIEAGHVKVNGLRVKPGKFIKPGDELTIKKGHDYHTCVIKTIYPRPVPPSLAREMYEMEELENFDAKQREILLMIEEEERKQRRKIKQQGPLNKKQLREMRKWKYREY